MIAENIENIQYPWSLDNKIALVKLHADYESGLSSNEAARRLEIAGKTRSELIHLG
jgi:hypothetical protein